MCLVGVEARASARYRARELRALGHEVRLIPPRYVRPFVKTNKNDAADAEAICQAVTRPTMRFTPVKGVEQQSVLAPHRARALLLRQRTRRYLAKQTFTDANHLDRRVHAAVRQRNLHRARHVWPHLPEAAKWFIRQIRLL